MSGETSYNCNGSSTESSTTSTNEQKPTLMSLIERRRRRNWSQGSVESIPSPIRRSPQEESTHTRGSTTTGSMGFSDNEEDCESANIQKDPIRAAHEYLGMAGGNLLENLMTAGPLGSRPTQDSRMHTVGFGAPSVSEAAGPRKDTSSHPSQGKGSSTSGTKTKTGSERTETRAFDFETHNPLYTKTR